MPIFSNYNFYFTTNTNTTYTLQIHFLLIKVKIDEKRKKSNLVNLKMWNRQDVSWPVRMYIKCRWYKKEKSIIVLLNENKETNE